MTRQYFIGTAFGGLFLTDNKARQYPLDGVFLNETTSIIVGTITGDLNVIEASDTLTATAVRTGGGPTIADNIRHFRARQAQDEDEAAIVLLLAA